MQKSSTLNSDNEQETNKSLYAGNSGADLGKKTCPLKGCIFSEVDHLFDEGQRFRLFRSLRQMKLAQVGPGERK